MARLIRVISISGVSVEIRLLVFREFRKPTALDAIETLDFLLVESFLRFVPSSKTQ